MKEKFLTEVILNQLKNLVLEVGEFNYNKTFQVPDHVAKIAGEAIKRIGNNDTIQTNTNIGSGKEKAIELSSKKSQNINQIKKMATFFSTNAASVISIKQKGGPKNNHELGIMQAWNLHGGESGNQWVKNELKKFHDENLRTKNNLRKAGGAGKNKGLGIFNTSLMNTTNHRIHK